MDNLSDSKDKINSKSFNHEKCNLPNFLPNGINVLNNTNLLQSIFLNLHPPAPPNLTQPMFTENNLATSRLSNMLSFQLQNGIHQQSVMKFLEYFKHISPVSIQQFDPSFRLHQDSVNQFASHLTTPVHMPYIQPFPMVLMESNNVKENSQQCRSDINKLDSNLELTKPKKRFLKRHYDDMKRELKPTNTDIKISVGNDEDNAPFGRSKCGKPLKRPAFIPSYMDNFNGPHLCVVCNHEASGLHYKAMTCEGCKGFFRRTIQQNLVYECKFNNDCNVNRETKKDVCRKCRWEKCLKSGMAKNSVLNEEERRLKNELIKKNKIKRQSKQIDPETNIQTIESFKAELTDESSGAETMSGESRCSLSPSSGSALSEWIKLLILIYKKSEFVDKKENNDRSFETHLMKQMIYLIQNLPGFEQLNDNEKVTLLQNRTVHCLLILSAFNYPESKDISFSDISILDKQISHISKDLQHFSSKVNLFNLSQSEQAIIFALIFLLDHKNLISQSPTIDQLETKYLEAFNYSTLDNIRRSKILLFVFPTVIKLVHEFQLNDNYQNRFLTNNFVSELDQILDQSFPSSKPLDEMPLSLKVESI